jgi:glutamate dehydrogenase
MSFVSATDEVTAGGLPARVPELIDAKVPADRAEAVRAFAAAFTRRMTPEDLEERTPEELLGIIVGAFELADTRAPDGFAVRVFEPSSTRDGYEAAGTVIEVSTHDSPFLYDSVNEELESWGLSARRVIHPVVGIERGPDRRIERVVPVRDAPVRESLMHFELEQDLTEQEREELEQAIRGILGDVRLAVRDFDAMRGAARGMIEIARAGSSLYPPEEVAETVSFLEWLLDLNFVFLGYREYDLVDVADGRALVAAKGSGLGILSKADWSAYEKPILLDTIEPNLRARIEGGDLLIYSKTNRTSTVHRRARMDYIGIRRVSPQGRIVGEARMVGLFTSKAYMEPAGKTPLLHRKLQQILESEDLYEGSHDYKAVVSIFESYPKDELFAASWRELREQVMGLLHLQEAHHIGLFVRRDLYGRSVSLLVAIPRDRFDAEKRHRLQDLFLERFEGTTIDYHLSLTEGGLAQLHFTVHVGHGQVPDVPLDELEREVIEIARSWEDRLLERLVAEHGPEEGRRLFERWADRFPDYYKAATQAHTAARDVARFEELEAGDRPFLIALANQTQDGEALTHVRVYKGGGKVELSDFVPTLESLGLRVVDEWPTTLLGDEGQDELFLHDFGVLGPDHRPVDVDESGERVAGCIAAVWLGECESDSLNRLVVTAGIDWRQVQILRAYRKFHHRVNASFPVEYKNDAFAAHPQVASKLVELFETRFDPATPPDAGKIEALRSTIRADLDAIRSLEHDRILRNALGVIDATVRTNVYVPGRASIAFKFSSAEVPEMPKPTPLYEVFVYSPDMEAVHLRAGKVARGGIRWSDRRQDYRTEVLGLLKAQIVKNAVIVPTGAKGGFVLKHTDMEPAALKEEATRQYVTFIRSMLELTDNLVDGSVVHPQHVVVQDEDDPYLVVAADKGTATFSDTANAISAEFGYWLGDAFASGGSAGYDHKELGITARGVWESVKRHFREIGTDVMNEPITVVGIGDMSGDVFGNGMLYTDQICLVAAFDHRHVFVDPTPHPALGFAERKRLFELPGSSWDDYDRSKISEGGGVWPRTDKSIPVSAQARLALGIEAEELTPSQLISAILRAPVDLLYNGGVGTYVKASDETHAEADDRVNDEVRVDGRDLRCRVVAEGGNLGFTQRGRIEFAQRGGRINTDFIDNSAGVDTSDHEVNLKILLGLAVSRGRLTIEERNALLAQVESDVVEHVLYDNFLQAQILSQEATTSPQHMEAYEDLMTALESDLDLDRDLQALPNGEEMAERRRASKGMTRPELAVLLAYSKQSLTNALLSSTLPDSAYLERDLDAYFPPQVVERFGAMLSEHPLRRELVAMLVANDVVNSQGITFVSRLVTETGADAADVTRAYRIARDVTGAVERWESIESLVGSVEPALLDELMAGVDRLVEVAARWYLQHVPGQLGRAIERYAEPFRSFAEAVAEAAPDGWRQDREREAWSLMDRGVPESVARAHAIQPFLVHGPNVVAAAEATGRSIADVTKAFFLVGDVMYVDWLEARVAEVSATTRWHRWAMQALEEDLRLLRRQVAERVLAQGDGALPVDEGVASYVASHQDVLTRLRRFMRGLAHEEASDLAALTVAVRQVRALSG